MKINKTVIIIIALIVILIIISIIMVKKFAPGSDTVNSNGDKTSIKETDNDVLNNNKNEVNKIENETVKNDEKDGYILSTSSDTENVEKFVSFLKNKETDIKNEKIKKLLNEVIMMINWNDCAFVNKIIEKITKYIIDNKNEISDYEKSYLIGLSSDLKQTLPFLLASENKKCAVSPGSGRG